MAKACVALTSFCLITVHAFTQPPLHCARLPGPPFSSKIFTPIVKYYGLVGGPSVRVKGSDTSRSSEASSDDGGWSRVHRRLYSSKEGSSQTSLVSRTSIVQAFEAATSLFPFWVLAGTAVGFMSPASMMWFTNEYITVALSVTMVCMGMTMKVEDVTAILERPGPVFIGAVLQYTIMPLSALFTARLFRLSPALSAGLVLVGCCPGGTASNLVSLIAQGDVALSVLMTTCSTIMAAVMTPFLTQLLVGGTVSLSGKALVVSTAQLVLAPVVAGMFLSTYAQRFCRKVSPFTPFLCVVLVSMICSRMVAVNAAVLLGSGVTLVAALATLHMLGFGVGYVASLLLGMGEKGSRTISIEVGMQNSALASVLAQRAFADPLCSLPGAVSATCHSLIGSTLAAIWRHLDYRKAKKAAAAMVKVEAPEVKKENGDNAALST